MLKINGREATEHINGIFKLKLVAKSRKMPKATTMKTTSNICVFFWQLKKKACDSHTIYIYK